MKEHLGTIEPVELTEDQLDLVAGGEGPGLDPDGRHGR
jgi:hypothetical protein